MTADQHTDLIDFLARKFDAIDRRFDQVDARLDAIERRVTALEVSHEAMRDDIRALAEGQAVLNARMDRFEAETRQRFDALEGRIDSFEAETRQRFDGIDVRFDRYEVDFGTVTFDHGRRIKALERTEEH
jgi:tetrahydromethanopterin S-methyltransferase subunit G